MIRHPLAHCKSCGLLFEARAIGLSNSTIQFKNVVTNCPRCGGAADVLDGTHRAYQDRLEVFLSPTISDEARSAILALIKRVQENKISLREAKKEARKIHPKLANLFDIANWSSEARAAFFSAIIIAGATLAAPLLAPAPRVENRVEIVVPKDTIQAPHKPKAPPKPKGRLRNKLLSTTTGVTPKNK